MSLLRSAAAGPRRRPTGALAILAVVLGVVTMHSMSGSSTTHSHAVPQEAPVVATASADAPPTAVVPGGHAVGERHAGPGEGSVGDESTAAMCLMVLVALLAVIVPGRRLRWRVLRESAMSVPLALAGGTLSTAPSLHELCISRT